MGYGPAVEVEMDNSNLYEELTGIVFSESEFGRDSETKMPWCRTYGPQLKITIHAGFR